MSERYQKPKTIDELRWFCDDHDIPAREKPLFSDISLYFYQSESQSESS